MATPTRTTQMKNPSIVLYGAGDAKMRLCRRLWSRTMFVGVCGSDVHFFRHDSISRTVDPAVAMTMGHEASGVISAIGPSVARVRPGDRVAIERGQLCRVCLPCKSGSYHLCKTMGFAADPGPPVTQGTLSKYYRIAEDFVYKVPGRCESGGGGAGGADERGGACGEVGGCWAWGDGGGDGEWDD
ncbi:hypothetical protein PMIN06_011633 [Paraphaeosphaeria minitans]